MRLAFLLLASAVAALAQQGPPPFVAGEDGSHSYRIPTVAATPKGALVVACEARRRTWVDKSPTDVVARRSADGGRSWEPAQVPLPGAGGAMMDPCLLADPAGGALHLIAAHWPKGDATESAEALWIATSLDEGASWSKPRRIPASALPKGARPMGVGPGAGFVCADGTLVMPVRLSVPSGDARRTRNFALVSRDGGATWKTGGACPAGGEFQIAEATDGRWVALRRNGARRMQTESRDGGITWGPERHRAELGGIEDGCQGSLHRAGQVLLHASPAGAPAKPDFDNRGRLTLWRSADDGATWKDSAVIHPLASGYSCMANLPDGRVALVWESADTTTFPRGRERPAGWMRIDLRLLPASVAKPGSTPVAR